MRFRQADARGVVSAWTAACATRHYPGGQKLSRLLSRSTLTRELKRFCATGGTLRGDIIEIQGDQRERLKSELERRGYTVKLAGG